MGGILLSDIKKSRPQAAAMAHSGGFSFYKRAKNSESSVDRKSQTYSGKSDQFVKTSERFVDIKYRKDGLFLVSDSSS